MLQSRDATYISFRQFGGVYSSWVYRELTTGNNKRHKYICKLQFVPYLQAESINTIFTTLLRYNDEPVAPARQGCDCAISAKLPATI